MLTATKTDRVITAKELNQVLSVLTDRDPLAWFKSQPESFQQEIALSIRSKSIKFASQKIIEKRRQDALWDNPLGTIVGKLGTKGLSIDTEYGSFVVKGARSDARYLILYIENGERVDESLSNSRKNVRASINIRQYSFPNAIPQVYDLQVKYDNEEVLYG